MRTSSNFPFEKARRITAKEVDSARRAIAAVTGVQRRPRGRPPKASEALYRKVSIRLHPKVMAWAKKVASREGMGYQTGINKVLLLKAH